MHRANVRESNHRLNLALQILGQPDCLVGNSGKYNSLCYKRYKVNRNVSLLRSLMHQINNI